MSDKKRIKRIYKFFMFLFVIIFVNIAYMSVSGKHLISGKDIAEYKKERDTRIEKISAKRGTIYDRNGEVIAKDSNTYTIIAFLNKDRYDNMKKRPAYVTDPEEYAKKLAPILNADEKELATTLSKKGLFQTELGIKGKGLPLSVKEKIEKLDLPGIEFETKVSRYYPNGAFASSTVGYATFDDEKQELVGKLGVEATYDSYLKGENGFSKDEVDSHDIYKRHIDGKEAVNGNDVYLTLDNNIQRIVESNMADLFRKNKPEMALAVVSDAKTNEILAVSSRPTFNPNKLDITDFNNPLVSLQFEPGSTMKAFTYASVLDSNPKFKLSNKYNSASRCIMDYGQCVQKIKNYSNNDWGRISYEAGFVHSSNTGIIDIFQKYLKPKTFENYLDKFKFFKPTGIEIPGEASGSKQMSKLQEAYTTGFGQSSSVTPIQMIQAMSAISNKGEMMRPYLLDKITNENNEVVREQKPQSLGKPISEKTSKEMLRIMNQVVENKIGVGPLYYEMKDYSMSGKTGTAEYVVNGRYATCETCYYNSFIAAAPTNNPRIIVYLITKYEKPTSYNPYDVRGEFIKNVTSNTLAYLNIKPDKKAHDKTEVKVFETESFINKSVDYAKKKLDNTGMSYLIIGNGDTIINQSIDPYTKTSSMQKMILLTKDKKYKMADLTDFSKGDVLKYAELLNLNVEFSNQGYVSNQNIKPGTVLNNKSKLKITLK